MDNVRRSGDDGGYKKGRKSMQQLTGARLYFLLAGCFSATVESAVTHHHHFYDYLTLFSLSVWMNRMEDLSIIFYTSSINSIYAFCFIGKECNESALGVTGMDTVHLQCMYIVQVRRSEYF